LSYSIDPDHLYNYRAITFHSDSDSALKDVSEAIDFVNQRGFLFLWPVKGIDLPSLWTAAAGDRPIASEHDDPGHVTWGWKDEMLDKKRWYYGKLLRGKATFVSHEILPYFYALTDRVGDLDDYNLLYDEGRLTFEEKSIADAILKHGALHTIELRRKSQMSATSAKSRFERALTALQRGLWILPIGIAEAGAWRYAFIYEFVDRWYPEVVTTARPIGIAEAYRKLTLTYLDSVGVAAVKDVAKLFRWNGKKVKEVLDDLHERSEIISLDDGRWATKKLFS
jgi:uncharacterized protein YcaQ